MPHSICAVTSWNFRMEINFYERRVGRKSVKSANLISEWKYIYMCELRTPPNIMVLYGGSVYDAYMHYAYTWNKIDNLI